MHFTRADEAENFLLISSDIRYASEITIIVENKPLWRSVAGACT